MNISIILPTISGREESREKMAQAYRDRTPGHVIEVISPKDYPCWPAACNVGQGLAKYDILHFGADDLEPLDGWAEPMLAALAASEIPAPQLWDFVPGGTPVNEAADGGPGAIPTFTRVPALTREMAERIDRWPEIPYYADNWVSDKGRLVGYETRVMGGYGFVHHWHPVGRLDGGDWVGRYKPLYNEERAKLGLPPV